MQNGFIYINDCVLPSLFAISNDEQEKGLMFEPFPPPIMSFIYPFSKRNQFWMKNTISPLDIVFCNKGEVVQICKGEPLSTATIGGDQLSDLIIELPYGTVQQNNFQLLHKAGIVKSTENKLKKIIAEKYGDFIKF